MLLTFFEKRGVFIHKDHHYPQEQDEHHLQGPDWIRGKGQIVHDESQFFPRKSMAQEWVKTRWRRLLRPSMRCLDSGVRMLPQYAVIMEA